MSLLMDVLRRFQFQKRRSPVHPSLLKKKEVRGRRTAAVMVGGLFLVSAVTAYFITDLLASRMEPAYPEARVSVRKVTTPAPERKEPETPPRPEPSTEKVQEEEPRSEERVEKPRTARLKPAEEIRKITEDIPRRAEEKPPARPPVLTVPPPEDTTTYLILADRHFREGNLQKSREYYEKANSVLRTEEIANNLLVVCVRTGDQDCVRKILAETPSEMVVYTYLMELLKAGLRERAVEEAEGYIHLDRRGYILFALGYAYETLGDYGRALENYGKAYRKNPHDPYLAYNYARLLDHMRRYRDAYSVYNRLKDFVKDPKIKKLVEERVRVLRIMGFGG
ncbi:MAG: tetratricopeptide repeat protein [Aquificota bacterium]|nr:tetratricopeptide repeat protein [Aquificota bacterium]